eukprot:3229809-Alexandrium_andersonii.AAC.1
MLPGVAAVEVRRRPVALAARLREPHDYLRLRVVLATLAHDVPVANCLAEELPRPVAVATQTTGPRPAWPLLLLILGQAAALTERSEGAVQTVHPVLSPLPLFLQRLPH